MSSFDSQRLILGLNAIRPWLIAIGLVWLLGAVGLGWLVKSFVFLLILLMLAPLLLFVGVRWWLSRNLVNEPCPVCGFQLTGLSTLTTRCPNCNESLEIESGHFQRVTPPGTIDVEVVDVTAQAMED